jgi:hypothetical protein
MDYNIYIDESCHMENDDFNVMCIGYVKEPRSEHEQIVQDIKLIKSKHKTPVELKWTKLSNSRRDLYFELIDYFFTSPLQFRSVLVKYKDKLDHDQFNQGSHDNFYYKLIYYLLRPNDFPDQYRVFLDIKDTRGREKLEKIGKVFSNYHRGNSPFIHFQHLRSNDNQILQLTDFFIGAITYKARNEHLKEGASHLKKELLNYIEKKAGYEISMGTEPWEEKFNIFDHQPKTPV